MAARIGELADGPILLIYGAKRLLTELLHGLVEGLFPRSPPHGEPITTGSAAFTTVNMPAWRKGRSTAQKNAPEGEPAFGSCRREKRARPLGGKAAKRTAIFRGVELASGRLDYSCVILTVRAALKSFL
jgi:hypothetical protein